MARLPIPRKQPPPSKPAQVMRRVATAWAALKLAVAGARAARRSAKKVGAAKDATKANKSKAALLAIPAAVAGGVIVWRKTRSGDSNGHREDFDRPLGPVATADTVSPPGTSSPGTTPPETSTPGTSPSETSSAPQS
jgi:hypothetical protein